MRKVIGLTGGIATGKSSIAKLFVDAGVYVIDSDVLVKEFLKTPEIIAKIVQTFGNDSIDENREINRKFMANLIFNDSKKRLALNEIIHPHVKKQIEILLQKRVNNLVVVDVPLMYEAGFDVMMDEVIVVYTTPEIQLERLMVRDCLTAEAAELRLASQMSIDEKRQLADYVIDNCGTKQDLYHNFYKVYDEIKLGEK